MLEAMIDRVIETEGGYVNHRADKGGPTKYGITLRALELYRGKSLTAEHVEDLGLPEARAIYLTDYWITPRFAYLGLPKLPSEMLFDAGVNHGPEQAVKLLQGAIGTLEDGILGPITQECAKRLDPIHLASLFMAERVSFYGKIITQNPSQAVFAAGWMARCAGFIQSIPLAQQ